MNQKEKDEENRKEVMANKAIVVFVKNPVLGKVKTRIAKDAGDEEALDIYKRLLQICEKYTHPVDGEKLVYYDQWIEQNDLFDNEFYQKKLQYGSNLGEKMASAFQELFKETYNKIILIGSDCPYLSKEIFETTFESLNTHDVVLGPTFDGGYYLVAMNSYYPQIFKDMTWSHENVLSDTIDRINTAGLSVHLLEKLQDIDHLEDWNRYLAQQNEK